MTVIPLVILPLLIFNKLEKKILNQRALLYSIYIFYFDKYNMKRSFINNTQTQMNKISFHFSHNIMYIYTHLMHNFYKSKWWLHALLCK